jgi:hypothetical protein
MIQMTNRQSSMKCINEKNEEETGYEQSKETKK